LTLWCATSATAEPKATDVPTVRLHPLTGLSQPSVLLLRGPAAGWLRTSAVISSDLKVHLVNRRNIRSRVKGWATRVWGWATVGKLNEIADLTFKLTATLAALATGSFFLFQANVGLDISTQPFVDKQEVVHLYKSAGKPVPSIVTQVIDEYAIRQIGDMEKKQNSTLGEYPAPMLCQDYPERVVAVFPGTDCNDPEARLGRNRWYERRLFLFNVQQLRPPLSDSDLIFALEQMHASEYRKVRCNLKNRGSVKADDVTIRVPQEFFDVNINRNNDNKDITFSLAPQEEYHRNYETMRGPTAADPHTETQFGVDWTRAQGLPGTGPAQWAVVILFAGIAILVAAVAVRDYRETAKKAPSNGGVPTEDRPFR
jgi:hypothetical protein